METWHGGLRGRHDLPGTSAPWVLVFMTMNSTPSDAFDLALLRAFQRIYVLRSLTAAAQSLGVTQSALSHALRRMRDTFKDELFVRSRAGLVPTIRADALFVSVTKILELVDREMVQAVDFDPAVSSRVFRISMDDITQVILFKPLMAQLGSISATCGLTARHWAKSAIVPAIENGEIELAVGHFPAVPDTFYRQDLYEAQYRILVADDHPRIAQRISWSEYSSEEHIRVATDSDAFLSGALQARGVVRRIRTSVDGFLSVPWLLKGSELIATVPAQVGPAIARAAGVTQMELPSPIGGGYRVQLLWHPRLHKDPGHKWLRDAVMHLLRGPWVLGGD